MAKATIYEVHTAYGVRACYRTKAEALDAAEPADRVTKIETVDIGLRDLAVRLRNDDGWAASSEIIQQGRAAETDAADTPDLDEFDRQLDETDFSVEDMW